MYCALTGSPQPTAQVFCSAAPVQDSEFVRGRALRGDRAVSSPPPLLFGEKYHRENADNVWLPIKAAMTKAP